MQRETPKSSLYVENWMASHSENYSLAISKGPDKVWPPHAKSLASVAIRMDTPFIGGQISDSKRRRGSRYQNNISPRASTVRVIQHFKKHTELTKAYRCLV